MIWSYLVAAGICDAKSYRIPNELIGLGIITGIMMNLESLGLDGVKRSVISAIFVTALLILLFIIKALGGGDIKLIAAVASMVGASAALKMFGISVFIATFAIIMMCIKERKLIRGRIHYSYYIAAAWLFMQLGRS